MLYLTTAFHPCVTNLKRINDNNKCNSNNIAINSNTNNFDAQVIQVNDNINGCNVKMPCHSTQCDNAMLLQIAFVSTDSPM